MKLAIGSDERNHVTDWVIDYLRQAGHEVELFGPVRENDEREWADVSIDLAESVGQARCEEGVLFCWTGTGSSIAANKVKGVRAALCVDAEEARGARKWNHANVLV
ncbi:MAG: RpiB/LacA/LacB family sugar-phosphate isomerase, partial [Saprospiraceae bacterium]|nr:RpiB/LacA/LacB family sugar-phosphate isomerase [Saprospiraceae bacterium]